jgi:hypothetical protein
MTPDLNAWLGNTPPLTAWLDDIDRAYDTARLIAEQSTEITVRRAGVAQAAQTVRLEPSGGPSVSVGELSIPSDVDVLIIGYKGHPSVSNTDIQRGDRFFEGDVWYEVTQTVPDLPGRLLAYAKASEA